MDNWRRLTARIRAEESAIRMSLEDGDTSFLSRRIEATDQLSNEIGTLTANDRSALPEGMRQALDDFQSCWPPADDAVLRRPILRERLVQLLSIAARIDYFVSQLERGRRLTLRAFEHLNRLISVDKSYAKRWQEAFRKKEPDCERLGAVHLLWHGVWAFKVWTGGARTDLIAGEINLIDVERKADILVLTEWKLVKKPSEQEKKAGDALSQARNYAAGVLGQIELGSPRFLILVSEKALPPLTPINDSGFVYEFINVVVNPDPPSKAAQALRKGTQRRPAAKASSRRISS